MQPDLAILAATSGHSGVDTIIRNLVPEFARLGVRTDILRIERHGPYLETVPPGCRLWPLGARHVETAFPALVRYLRRERPAVLFTDKDSVNRMALLARQVAGADCRCAVRLGTTVSVNLANRKRWQAALQRLSIRRLYRRADTVIVPSHGAAKDLAAIMEAPASRITVLPNPVIHPGLEPLATEPVNEPWFEKRDRPIIVAAGSLTPRKDYTMLVDAFARLRARRPCRLILVGDGNQRTALEAQAQRLGVEGDVRFTGFLRNPYPYIAHADVFAHSSRWEGLGVVLVEALALGTPVVSTNCPSGPSEVLDGGRVGRLVPVGDAAAMAEALAATLDEPTDADRLRAAVAGYRADVSARAYLRAFGLSAVHAPSTQHHSQETP
jgi:glycosyltransferase involved in cell wall biosynthesis